MPKRKANTNSTSGSARSSKSPARAPLPPANDDDDSDFCEIVEGPIVPSEQPANTAAPTQAAPTQASPNQAAPSQATPAHFPHPSHASFLGHPHGHHGSGNAGVLSMFAGMSGSMPYIQPAPLAGFSFPQMSPVGGFIQQGHQFAYGSPNMYTAQAGFQGQGFIPALVAPNQSAGSSSGGGSSGARRGASSAAAPLPAQTQVRVREGASAEEVKEEPDDLIPTQAELPLVERMRAHGCRTDDAVQSLRQNGHDVNASLHHALEITCSRQNSRMEDMARLESEKEKQRIADAQRHEDMTLTVLGDIEPRFRESLLLDKEEGCAVFRRAIRDLCSGEDLCTPALCAFREKAVKLLFLERDALRWYRDVKPQVRAYFRKLVERLQCLCPESETEAKNAEHSVAPAQAVAATASGEAEGAKRPGPNEEAQGPGSSDNTCVDRDAETEVLTACVAREVDALERILFMIPDTTGGVPEAFLQCDEHAVTLEADGVEEVRHQSADASRLSRSGERVLITVNDDE